MRTAALPPVVAAVVALAVGMRDSDISAASTALATGASATVAFLVGSAAVLSYLSADRGVVVTAVFALGTALGVGVQFAVVTYAGVALGEGRRDESEPAAA